MPFRVSPEFIFTAEPGSVNVMELNGISNFTWTFSSIEYKIIREVIVSKGLAKEVI